MLFLTLKCVYEFVNRRDVNRHKEMNIFELKNISKWSSDLFHLIYPNTCLICENELPPSNKFICSFCHNDFNYTYFERYTEAEKIYSKAIAVSGSKKSYQKLANLYKNKMNQPEKAKLVLETYQEKNKS